MAMPVILARDRAHMITVGAALLLFVCGGAVGAWSLWQFTIHELSVLGGFVGGTVGPLWSAASLLLLYAAYNAQKAQLELQRHEIRENSLEQQLSRVESRFYELLRLHNAQVEHLDASTAAPPSEIAMRGKRCLYSYHVGVTSEFARASARWKGMIGHDPNRIGQIMSIVAHNHAGSIHGYYISVDSLLKALDKTERFDPALANDLSDLLVAQFADFELSLLFLKFYSDARFSKALDRARRFGLFRNFDEESIWRDLERGGDVIAAT